MPPQVPQQQYSVTPQSSETPLLSSDERQPETSQLDGDMGEDVEGEMDPKTGKRRFFGLGKKKEDKKETASSSAGKMSPPPAIGSMRPPSPGKQDSSLRAHPQPIPVSPNRQSAYAASPSRMRSSSPRLHSPASSEIFERNVQEPVSSTLQGELSPAHIPSHVITEDHIPPALEASANAITSDELNPDEVEVITATAHQPAAVALEVSSSHADLTQLASPMSPLHHVKSEDSEASAQLSSIIPPPGEEDGANYGSLNPTDPRRLSFISFADVVQSEHQAPPQSALSEAGNRDSLHFGSLPASLKQERAASPLRSEVSRGVTTPPPGVNVSAANLEQSPGRTSGLASPMSPTSELQIETMRQAVRKTASGDLSGGRSAMASPISDENLSSAPRSRTNS
jgi:hypothetical protein